MLLKAVPAGSPSRGWDVMVYVKDINQLSLLTPFLFCSFVYFCLFGPYNYIFPVQLSALSLCSVGLNSALLVLSTVYMFRNVSLSPDIILCG